MAAPRARAETAAARDGADGGQGLPPVRRDVHGSLFPLTAIEPRQLAAWRSLADRAAEPNPFFEPECVLPAARHLGASHLALLVVEDGSGEWLACMPVSSTLRVRGHRVPAFGTWRYLYAPLATPLVDGAAVEPAVEHLLRQAFRASRLGVVALPWIGEDGPVAAAVQGVLEAGGRRPALHRTFARAVMRRPTLDGGVESLLGRGHRRDLERLGRRLAEQLGGPLEVREECDRPAAVEGFLAVEASGWKGEHRTAFASREADAAYFREVCHGFREAGRLQMLTLGSADRTVSYKCNFLAGDAVFCFKIAFDDAYARYRPGIQLELRMLELFRDRMNQSWMDSCAAPDSPLFEHLWPERRRIGSYVLTAGRTLGWTIEHAAGRLVGRSGS